MAALARPTSLLEQMRSHFVDQAWPVTDLAKFRMELDEDEDDDLEDDTKNPPTLTADDIEKMQKALHKANKEAEQNRLKLKEYEDRDKTDTEKLSERTRELESNLTAAEQRSLRMEIALDKGIPKSVATRLQGSTREEMEADADQLLKELGGVKKPQSLDGGAKETPHEGGGSFLSKAIRDKRTA